MRTYRAAMAPLMPQHPLSEVVLQILEFPATQVERVRILDELKDVFGQRDGGIIKVIQSHWLQQDCHSCLPVPMVDKDIERVQQHDHTPIALEDDADVVPAAFVWEDAPQSSPKSHLPNAVRNFATAVVIGNHLSALDASESRYSEPDLAGCCETGAVGGQSASAPGHVHGAKGRTPCGQPRRGQKASAPAVESQAGAKGQVPWPASAGPKGKRPAPGYAVGAAVERAARAAVSADAMRVLAEESAAAAQPDHALHPVLEVEPAVAPRTATEVSTPIAVKTRMLEIAEARDDDLARVAVVDENVGGVEAAGASVAAGAAEGSPGTTEPVTIQAVLSLYLSGAADRHRVGLGRQRLALGPHLRRPHATIRCQPPGACWARPCIRQDH